MHHTAEIHRPLIPTIRPDPTQDNNYTKWTWCHCYDINQDWFSHTNRWSFWKIPLFPIRWDGWMERRIPLSRLEWSRAALTTVNISVLQLLSLNKCINSSQQNIAIIIGFWYRNYQICNRMFKKDMQPFQHAARDACGQRGRASCRPVSPFLWRRHQSGDLVVVVFPHGEAVQRLISTLWETVRRIKHFR